MTQDHSSRRMNILVFSTLFPHKGEPTQGIFVENRLRHLLKDEDVDATVIAPVPWFPFKSSIFGKYGRAAQTDQEEIKDGLKIYHPRYLVIPKVGMMLTPYFLARAAKRAAKKAMSKGVKFELIDAHYLYPDGVAASHLAKFLKLPFTMTARGSDVTQIALMARPKRLILKACEAAAHVITVSQSLKDKLTVLGVDHRKISVLRNGVDSEIFKPVGTARDEFFEHLGLDLHKSTIVSAGWLIPRKRVDIVIAAVSHLPNSQAIIVGDGPLRRNLEAQVKTLQLHNRVKFVGQKKPDEMPEFFSFADVLCLPSEREGWANVMLEAMACGAAVVARRVDGAIELITADAPGGLVDGDDPESYGHVIEKILAKLPDRNDVRSYALEYSWRSTSSKQMQIFQRITR